MFIYGEPITVMFWDFEFLGLKKIIVQSHYIFADLLYRVDLIHIIVLVRKAIKIQMHTSINVRP